MCSLFFTAFSAVGIRVRLFGLCLVSACFRASGYLSVFGIMLCACCSSASSLEIRTGFFSRSVTLWTDLQIQKLDNNQSQAKVLVSAVHSVDQ